MNAGYSWVYLDCWSQYVQEAILGSWSNALADSCVSLLISEL